MQVRWPTMGVEMEEDIEGEKSEGQGTDRLQDIGIFYRPCVAGAFLKTSLSFIQKLIN